MKARAPIFLMAAVGALGAATPAHSQEGWGQGPSPVRFTEVVNADDVGMLNLRSQQSFVDEAKQKEER